MQAKRRLLCICYEFAPQPTPTAIRTGKLLSRLSKCWKLNIVTAAPQASLPSVPDAQFWHVPQPPPSRIRKILQKLRLPGLIDTLNWPDDKRSWIPAAIEAALKAIGEAGADVVVVFMMPYSSGIVGLEIKRLTGLPIVMNFDDSPTCDDMHPEFPSASCWRRSVAMEDRIAREADAVVYVSQRNLDRVLQRQPEAIQRKFHLVRFGADPADFVAPVAPRFSLPTDVFRIVYIGEMSGWYYFRRGANRFRTAVQKIRSAINGLGRKRLIRLDPRGSSPVYIAKAVQRVIGDHPEWSDRIRVELHGIKFPRADVQSVLESEGIADVVSIHGPIINSEAIKLAREADLLFQTLPDRPDGSPGGRISAKTYEYLMTDRPILAAVPPGENRDYLRNWPGVWITSPLDVDAMAQAIEANILGPMRWDRRGMAAEITYDCKATEFAGLLDSIPANQLTGSDSTR